MARKKLAETRLAEWLAQAMALRRDPDTRMPGLPQYKLASFSGVSQAQIHEILKKGHAPNPDTLKKLALFFEVNPLKLFYLAYLTKDEIDVQAWDDVFELEEWLNDLGASLSDAVGMAYSAFDPGADYNPLERD